MTLQAGDRVVAESESTERPARYGTVEEVVRCERDWRRLGAVAGAAKSDADAQRGGHEGPRACAG
jgi:hypothetical protein